MTTAARPAAKVTPIETMTSRSSPRRRDVAPTAARVLFANVSRWWHGRIAAALTGAGHLSVGLARDADDVHRWCEERLIDVVVVGRDGEAPLSLVRWISHEGGCPVVVSLAEADPAFVASAAEHGAYAFVVGTSPRDWEAALALGLTRYRRYRALQDAFERRAVVERAKGILMERQGIGETEAFQLLRDHARRHSKRVVDVAESVVESQRLLHSTEPPATRESE
jgi:response regulator NasT